MTGIEKELKRLIENPCVFPSNQSEEACLKAVKKDGMEINVVKHQTPELCMLAVKKNSFVLQFVRSEFKYLFKGKNELYRIQKFIK